MAKKQKKIPKARNPFVQGVMLRPGAGVHDKPYKVKRAAEKVAMKKRARDDFDPDHRIAA